ncbi:rootletin-like [Coregonus clupeaformis]|uniref:rootletin-like n=1 Tax=Coregonus clupeaformis TaxID=59861 RepID=UPI001E1C35F3|nr:rootletin-like [Coregonus clupeaformis]
MLEEEQKRCVGLSQVNALLREQLEQAGSANQGLTESLRRASEDVEQKDARLRKEQETRASRVGREQARVRALWRQAASLRSTFTQLRTFADRSLSDIRGECVTASRRLHVACMSLEASVTQHSAPSGPEVSELERQLRDKLREAMQLQGHWDAEKVELNSRILELTDMVKHLRAQNSEKDTGLAAMQTSLDTMETSRADDRAEMDDYLSEIDILQKVLTSITQLVDGDGDCTPSSSSPLRGRSPQCNSTLMAVQGLQIQTQDLRSRLDAALEQVDTLRSHLQEGEEERRDLEGRIQEVQRENQQAGRSLEDSHRDNQRFRASLDLLNSEKASLEKLIVGLQQQTESLGAELEVMRGSAGDLQRQRDLLRQQRDDMERQLERQRTEAQRGERSLEQLEGKNSDLRRELVTVREALSQVTLQKEVLEDEKSSLALSLSKVTLQKEVLEDEKSSLALSLSKQVREALSQVTLQKEVLEDEKSSLALSLSKVTLQKEVLEDEKSSLALSLSKVTLQKEVLEDEKSSLALSLSKVTNP